MNRVIDGVDLDGSEFLDSDESRIKIVNGEVQLKLENFWGPTVSMYNAANQDPRNWSINPRTGQRDIGVSLTLASIQVVRGDYGAEHPYENRMVGPDPSILFSGPIYKNVIQKEARLTNQSGNTLWDKRYTITLQPTTAGKIVTGTAGLVGMINEYSQIFRDYLISDDIGKARDHIRILTKDVLPAIDKAISRDIVPEWVVTNEKKISALANFLLQGESTGDKKLDEIGRQVWDKVVNEPKTISAGGRDSDATKVKPIVLPAED
jgi:hypothetical protein